MTDRTCVASECPALAAGERMEELMERLELLSAAFPEDKHGRTDVDGHRRYHEAKIQAAEAEAAFWRDLKLDLAKKGAWAILLVLAGLLVAGVATKLG